MSDILFQWQIYPQLLKKLSELYLITNTTSAFSSEEFPWFPRYSLQEFWKWKSNYSTQARSKFELWVHSFLLTWAVAFAWLLVADE